MKQKKIVAMIVLFMVIMGCIGGCRQETSKCEFCYQEKVCETREILEEEVKVCKDCIKEVFSEK